MTDALKRVKVEVAMEHLLDLFGSEDSSCPKDERRKPSLPPEVSLLSKYCTLYKMSYRTRSVHSSETGGVLLHSKWNSSYID